MVSLSLKTNQPGIVSQLPLAASTLLLAGARPELSQTSAFLPQPDVALRFARHMGIGFCREGFNSFKELGTLKGMATVAIAGLVMSRLPMLFVLSSVGSNFYGVYTLVSGINQAVRGKGSLDEAAQRIGEGLFFGAQWLTVGFKVGLATHSRQVLKKATLGAKSEGRILTRMEEFQELIQGIRSEVDELVKGLSPKVAQRIRQAFDNPTIGGLKALERSSTPIGGTVSGSKIYVAEELLPQNVSVLEAKMAELGVALTKYHEAVHMRQFNRNPRFVDYCEALNIDEVQPGFLKRIFTNSQKPPLIPFLRNSVKRLRAMEQEAYQKTAEVVHRRLKGVDWEGTYENMNAEKLVFNLQNASSKIPDWMRSLGSKHLVFIAPDKNYLDVTVANHFASIVCQLQMKPSHYATAVINSAWRYYPSVTIFNRSYLYYLDPLYLYGYARKLRDHFFPPQEPSSPTLPS